jgi:uncharacterized membrane protein
MLNLGFYHPLVIHFAISLLLLGVLLRWVSLTNRFSFTGPAATTLLLLGTVAVVAAAWSGEEAHIAVEAIPGIASIVRAHQLWGERTRTVVLGVMTCELLALLLKRSGRARLALLASGLLGVVSSVCVMQTGKLGGELVYAHAGGVGIRSGTAEDVGRLLLAGLYHQAQLDARAGRLEDAAALIEVAARRFPDDAAVQVLAAESLLQDRHDPQTALALLQRSVVPQDDRQLHFRQGWLTADAFDALGQTDRARATLQALQAEFPDSARVRRRLAAATTRTPPPVPAQQHAP